MVAPSKPTTAAQTKIPTGKTAETKPKRERKPLADIPLDLVSTARISPEDAGKVRPFKEGVRNETQRKLDDDVKQAYTDWIAAGKEHKVWEKMAPWSTKVPKQHEEVIKQYLRKAGQFHNVQIRFGRSLPLPDGLVVVTWVAKDRAPKEDKTETK